MICRARHCDLGYRRRGRWRRVASSIRRASPRVGSSTGRSSTESRLRVALGRRSGAPSQTVKNQIRVRWLAERDLEEAEDWYATGRPWCRVSPEPSLTSSPALLQIRRSILRFMVRFVAPSCSDSPTSPSRLVPALQEPSRSARSRSHAQVPHVSLAPSRSCIRLCKR